MSLYELFNTPMVSCIESHGLGQQDSIDKLLAMLEMCFSALMINPSLRTHMSAALWQRGLSCVMSLALLNAEV